MKEKNPRSILFLRCGHIDLKTKYYKDRRGLEQEEEVVAL